MDIHEGVETFYLKQKQKVQQGLYFNIYILFLIKLLEHLYDIYDS